MNVSQLRLKFNFCPSKMEEMIHSLNNVFICAPVRVNFQIGCSEGQGRRQPVIYSVELFVSVSNEGVWSRVWE